MYTPSRRPLNPAEVAQLVAACAAPGEKLVILALVETFSPHSLSNRATIFYRARFDEAIRAGQQALDLEPRFVNALWWQGLSYAGSRDFSKSIACLTNGRAMNDGQVFRTLFGLCLWRRR